MFDAALRERSGSGGRVWAGCGGLPEPRPPAAPLGLLSPFPHYLHVRSRPFGRLRSMPTYFSLCERWERPLRESLAPEATAER